MESASWASPEGGYNCKRCGNVRDSGWGKLWWVPVEKRAELLDKVLKKTLTQEEADKYDIIWPQ